MAFVLQGVGRCARRPVRIEIWDNSGGSVVEHVAGADDFQVAEAIYQAAISRWPTARITLRQGIRVVRATGQRLAH